MQMQLLYLYISRWCTIYNGLLYVHIPDGLTIDPVGALFIEDISGEHRIRIDWLTMERDLVSQALLYFCHQCLIIH